MTASSPLLTRLFDIEVAAHLREHFRMTGDGHGESIARLFRDKLAMRGIESPGTWHRLISTSARW
ncbi:MAG: hypothetical protein U0792_04305 [Gemmataceae bacterium]